MQRRRKNKKGKVEPKVKVESAVVDMATGKAAGNAAGEAETRVVQVLFGFFGILLTEGLVLAGSVSAIEHNRTQQHSKQLALRCYGSTAPLGGSSLQAAAAMVRCLA